MFKMIQQAKKVACAGVIAMGILAISETSALAACANPVGQAGDMMYNADFNVMQYCDDTDWTAMRGGTSAAELVDADSDTRIQVEESADEDIIRFDTAGTERMTIDASGFVGIGDSTPTTILDVVRDYATDANTSRNVGTFARFYGGGPGVTGIGAHIALGAETTVEGNRATIGRLRAVTTDATDGAVDADIYLDPVSNSGMVTDAFVVKSTGNVGMGIANPVETLQIDSAGGTGAATLYTNGTSGSTATDGLWVGYSNAGYIWNYENTKLGLATNNIERVTIDENGNVGVGVTPVPAIKFYTQDSTAGNTAITGSSSATTGFGVGVSGSSSSTSGTGVAGLAGAATGDARGVQGTANSPAGYGGYFENTGDGGVGLYGYASSTLSGTSRGVFGQSASTGGRGVHAWASANSGTNYGLYAATSSASGYGAYITNIAGGTALKVQGGVLDMTSQKITNVTDPTAAQDAATKAYVDAQVSGASDNLGNHTATQSLNMGGFSVNSAGIITGTQFVWENGVNRITNNDGAGNVQMRWGHDFSSSDERFTHGGGAVRFTSNIDATANTLLTINTSSNPGAGNDQPVTWGNSFNFDATHLNITGTTDSSLTAHGLMVLGNKTSTNITMDGNEIIARNNGATSTLFLNTEGGNVSIGGGRILGIADPTGAQDAATKAYVDAAISGGSADADTLDTLDSTQFIRADVNDNVSAHTEWQDSQEVRLGTMADFRMMFNGTDTYMSGFFDGARVILRGQDAGNTMRNLILADPDNAVTLYYAGSSKLATTNTGISVTGDVDATGSFYYGDGKEIIDFNDTWVRLNQNGDFTSGVYTPGTLQVDGLLRIDASRGLTNVTGNYGTVQTNGSGVGNWEGYSIDGRAVFVHDGASATGIYNDVNNEWLIYAVHNAGVELRYNNNVKLTTTNTGATVTGTLTATTLSGALNGDLITNGTVDSSEIQDNTLTAADLAANSVGASELANNAVDTAAIAGNAVTGAKIASSTIGLDKLSATGTKNNTTFLRGDNTWATPPGSGANCGARAHMQIYSITTCGGGQYLVYPGIGQCQNGTNTTVSNPECSGGR